MAKFLKTLIVVAWIATTVTVLYGFYSGRLYCLLQGVVVYHESNPLGPPLPPVDPNLKH